MIKTPVSVGALRKLMKELQAAGKDRKPLALGGAAELARTLERELTRGGDPSAVRVGAYTGSSVKSCPRAISSAASALSRKQLPQYIPAAPAVMERTRMGVTARPSGTRARGTGIRRCCLREAEAS